MKVTSTESGGYPTELAPAGESRPRGCNRASKFQFRISTILLAMLGSALVLSIVTQVDLESWFANAPRRSYHEPSGAWRWLGHPLVTIGLIELIAGMAVVEVLARNIPRAIKRDQRRNCRRADGTWSRRRQRVENASISQLGREMQFACLMVALVTNMLLGVVHYEIIPIPLAWRAVSEFRGDTETWKQDLRDEAAEYDKWLAPSTVGQSARQRKRMLWIGWPVVVATLAGWGVAASVYIGASYAYALRRLSAAVRFRSQQYRLRELHELVGSDDYAHVLR